MEGTGGNVRGPKIRRDQFLGHKDGRGELKGQKVDSLWASEILMGT